MHDYEDNEDEEQVLSVRPLRRGWGVQVSDGEFLPPGELEGASGLSHRGDAGGDGLRLLSCLLKMGSFSYLKIHNAT